MPLLPPHLQRHAAQHKVAQLAVHDALLGLGQLGPLGAVLDGLEGLVPAAGKWKRGQMRANRARQPGLLILWLGRHQPGVPLGTDAAPTPQQGCAAPNAIAAAPHNGLLCDRRRLSFTRSGCTSSTACQGVVG